MPGYHLPYFAAVDAGIFHRHGVDVTLLDPAPGPANPRRVADGGADFCLTSVVYYLRAWAERPGLAARFIFPVAQRSHLTAFVVDDRPTAAGKVPTQPSDLAGAIVGGMADNAFIKEYQGFFHRMLGISDTPLAEMGYQDAMASLGAGRCDVFVDYLDLLPRVQRRNPTVMLRAFHFADYGLSIYGSGLVASERLIHNKPETVIRLLSALREAYEFTRQQPELGLPGLLRHYPDTDPEYALDSWRLSARLIFGWEAKKYGPGWLERERWAETVRYTAAVHGLSLPPIDATFA